MKTRTLTPTLALALLPSLLAVAPARAATGFLQAAIMSTRLDGDLHDRGVGGDELSFDLSEDLGFDRDPSYEVRGGVRSGRHRFSVAAARFDHEVDQSDRDFEFNGIHFTADTSFANRLRWAEAEYAFAPVHGSQGRLELLAGARLFDYHGEAEGRTTLGPIGLTRREEVDETGPVPHIGAAFELTPARLLFIRGSGKGLSLGLGNDRGHEIDIEGTVGVRVIPMLEVGAGLRQLNLWVSLDEGATVIDVRYTAAVFYARIGG